MHRGGRRRLQRHVAALSALALTAMTAACGTRLPDEAFVRADQGRAGTQASGADGSDGDTGGDSALGPAGPNAPGDTSGGADPAGGGDPADPAPAGGGDPANPTPAPGGDTGAVTGPNQASDTGVTETTIRIGTIVAENGVLGNVFQPAASGLRAWTEWINAQGGIHGRRVELFTCDDREDRARALECARRLVEQDQVFALVATNTRALGGATPYLAEAGIPVLGFPIHAGFYRFPNFYSIYGAPYARDGQTAGHNGQLASYSTIYRWFRENLDAQVAAVITYDIAESSQAGDFMVQGLEAEGFEVHRYTVSFAAPSFDGPVADMQRRGVQLIFDGMDTGANVRLCDTMARRGFQPLGKVSTVVAYGASFGEQFNDSCRPVAFIPGDSRPFTDTGHPVVAEFRQAFDRYQRGRELHQWALEAWAIAELVRRGIESMGPAPTQEGLHEFLGNVHNDDLGGVFTPTLHWRHNDPPLDAETVRDCIALARWSDDAGGWVSAIDFPYCVNDARQFFTPLAEQGT